MIFKLVMNLQHYFISVTDSKVRIILKTKSDSELLHDFETSQ